MITTLDDYPIHQTPQPLAIPATSDRNFYDRFWFNGFVGDGSLYFSVAMGFYPNRRVIDGGFSVVVDGQQYCLHLSGDPPLDRTHTELGPLRIETLVPMRRHRIVVNCPERGFEAELLFEAATGAHEEGRQILNDGLHTAMDLTRVTQFGNWSGWIVVKGKRIEVSAARTNGTRDRSWGVRPCGEPSGRPHRWASQFYFAWSQTFWPEYVLHGLFYSDAKGGILLNSGGTVPRVPQADTPVFARDTHEIAATPCGYQFDYAPGSRRIKHAFVRYQRPAGEILELEYEPLLRFHMAGLGYFNPEWGHGFWKGDFAIDDETWKLDEIDMAKPAMFHIQQVCKVTMNGRDTSVGILEHAAYGPHEPSGFKELLDVAGAG